MGCLFKSFGIILIMAIILPVFLLISLFGRIRSHTKTTNTPDENRDNTHQPQNEHVDEDLSDKPIDSSTIEYIEFEEIKDHEK